jgi:nucleotide-binding universal stress UspA family protein
MSIASTAPVAAHVYDDSYGPAARHAAHEAVLNRCGLRLVHTYPGDARPGQRELAAATLQRAVDRVREARAPSPDVTGVLVQGPPVEAILDASSDCRMVVLEHRDVLRLVQAITRSSRAGMAPYPYLTVACVPHAWSPPPPGSGPVTVGVETTDECATVLDGALEIARAHRTTLQVLHTWSLPAPYDEAVLRRVGAEWEAKVRSEIASALALLGDAARDVPVVVEVRHGSPAQLVIDAARDSEVLVLTRHDARAPVGSHLGRVARSALYASPCPVVLLPAAVRPAGEDLGSEPSLGGAEPGLVERGHD